MRVSTRSITVLVLLAISAALTACGRAGKPAAGAQPQTLSVSLTDAGCTPASLRAKTGSITFAVENGGSGKVSELELKNAKGIILGERENIVAGISGSFTLNLQPGTYVLNCPNGDREDNGRLVVTGRRTVTATTVAGPLLAQATGGYRTYVSGQADQLLAGTRTFVAALRAGDVERAKSLFGPVRAHYEAIEPVAESFGDLDPEIDARENDVASPAVWTGFHRIEKILWLQNTTQGTGTYATKLLADVTTLDRQVRTLRFQPAQLANGAVELLNEVANSKITGEEDRYSHTDLSDFQANLDGSQQAFQLLRPALAKRGDAELGTTIAARFAAVHRGLDRYRRSTPLGFALYDALTPKDRRALAQQVDALAEPLSTVAAKVSG
jgi:iron uptake system component EfeO